MKHLIFNIEPEGFSDEARTIWKGLGEYRELEIHDINHDISKLANASILIVRLRHRIDKHILSQAPHLKILVSATTGLDHIEIEACNQRGISIISLKGEYEFLRSVPATAELTWGLLLSLTRKLPWAITDTQAGNWRRDLFRGVDLAQKTLGICGFGRIGEKVARYAQAFQMNVIAFDPYKSNADPQIKLIKDWKNFLSSTDILSIHIPYEPQTKNFINRDALLSLPRGARVINTSRGSVLDEVALLNLLTSRHLSGAALDVVSDELESDRKMFKALRDYAASHHNLILTPHLGGASMDSMRSTEIFVANKTLEFLKEARV